MLHALRKQMLSGVSTPKNKHLVSVPGQTQLRASVVVFTVLMYRHYITGNHALGRVQKVVDTIASTANDVRMAVSVTTEVNDIFYKPGFQDDA